MNEMDRENADDVITCWCGEQGTFDELFSDGPFQSTCGGDGYLNCYCGGDQCVCHWHGQEVECPGCDECCNGDDDDYDEGN